MADTVSLFVTLPPIGIASAAFTGTQLYFALIAHGLQRTDPQAYSKFSKPSMRVSKRIQVGTRIFFALVYTPAFIVSASFTVFHFYRKFFKPARPIMDNLRQANLNWLLPSAMVLGHFTKRILECCFLHRYSAKKVDVMPAVSISAFYGMVTAGCCYFQSLLPVDYYTRRCDGRVTKLGVAVWASGLLGNLYHVCDVFMCTLFLLSKQAIRASQKVIWFRKSVVRMIGCVCMYVELSITFWRRCERRTQST